MAVDERARHELHDRLGQILGPDAAATLMAHLPPAGWGDVVTRDYLDSRLEHLDARIDRRFSELDSRFAAIDGRFAEMESRFAAIDGRFPSIDERFLRIEHLIESSKHEVIATMREEIGDRVIGQTRAIIFAMITAVAAVCGLAVTIATLG